MSQRHMVSQDVFQVRGIFPQLNNAIPAFHLDALTISMCTIKVYVNAPFCTGYMFLQGFCRSKICIPWRLMRMQTETKRQAQILSLTHVWSVFKAGSSCCVFCAGL